MGEWGGVVVWGLFITGVQAAGMNRRRATEEDAT
jgi:hypothetical protein